MTLDLNLTLEGGFAYSNNLLFSEHTGTHIDAPMHFHDPEAEEPQWYTHQIPPERLDHIKATLLLYSTESPTLITCSNLNQPVI